jgi:hypothetical protein
MSTCTRQYRKVKVRRFKTYPSRHGQGVVHLLAWGRVVTRDAWIWDTPRKVGDEYWSWQKACLRGRSHGEEIGDPTDDTKVTCKACLASGWVPPDWRPGDAQG